MEFITWGRNPWTQEIPIHISWNLLYLSVIGAVLFMVAHTLYVRFRPAASAPAQSTSVPSVTSRLPERIVRHSFAARLFHWIMAASMITLLVTAFLPIAGVKFAWVTIHWIGGLMLTTSIVYHVIHASFWLDFWSIWLNKEDLEDSWRRVRRVFGMAAPAPHRAGKYPADNKMY